MVAKRDIYFLVKEYVSEHLDKEVSTWYYHIKKERLMDLTYRRWAGKEILYFIDQYGKTDPVRALLRFRKSMVDAYERHRHICFATACDVADEIVDYLSDVLLTDPYGM